MQLAATLNPDTGTVGFNLELGPVIQEVEVWQQMEIARAIAESVELVLHGRRHRQQLRPDPF